LTKAASSAVWACAPMAKKLRAKRESDFFMNWASNAKRRMQKIEAKRYAAFGPSEAGVPTPT
jgi:hypothetical protein